MDADLDIFKTYGIQQRPHGHRISGRTAWKPAGDTPAEGQPEGHGGKQRNALSTDDWARLVTYLEKKGVKPIVIGHTR